MITPRAGHTATLLNNGQVLIAGGSQVLIAGGEYRSTYFSSAELYDPDTGSFVATGRMTTARGLHTATLLPNGKVLIAGGRLDDGGQVLASAELYDPDTATFTPTGDMNVSRAGHTATLLNNGQVLIVGGWTPSPPGVYPLDHSLTSAELYDPLTGVFTATGNMSVDWFGFTATLLADGKVLIATPYDGVPFGSVLDQGDSVGANVELYDPLTSTFTRKGPPSDWGFYWHTASLLPNGKVLIAGGGNADMGEELASAVIYDPGSGTFAATGNMAERREFHAATVLLDNTVLITGGASGETCCSAPPTAIAELYNPDTGTFTYMGVAMTKPRYGHTATLLNNGMVLIAGGLTGPRPVTTENTELYVPRFFLPALVVTDLRFDRSSVTTGSSYSVNVSGSNLTPQTFFDVRFTAPGSTLSNVVMNWQNGLTGDHVVLAGTASGIWTINGVRAHNIETDHTGNFLPVSATITVSP